MRVIPLCLGTRGDIQPFAALGLGLSSAGHDVTLCASASFGPWITGLGLRFAPVSDDIVNFAKGEAGRRAMERKGGILGLPRRLFEASNSFKAIFHRTLAEQWQAAQGAEAIVYHPNAVGGYHIAEGLGIAGIMADPLPTWVPTATFPHIVTPALSLGRFYNRITHRVIGIVPRLLFGRVVNRWRTNALRLPPCPLLSSDLQLSDGQPVPVLLGFSRHVVPPPPDWPKNVRVTGYWFLNESATWCPPSGLVEFLQSGPPPVFVSFGSMAGGKPAQAGQTVVNALAETGYRGVIVTGWGGITVNAPPSHIYVAENIPYDWVFPHVATLVHHGGAGTTAVGLAAGKTAVICPFVADQPFWGRRLHALGVAPPPIPQNRLTVPRLAAAIRQATTDTDMLRRAAELGEKIRAEHGVANAVDLIVDYLSSRHHRPSPAPVTNLDGLRS